MSHDKVGVIGALSAEVGRRYSSSVRESGRVGQKGGVRCPQSGPVPRVCIRCCTRRVSSPLLTEPVTEAQGRHLSGVPKA